MLLSRRFIAYQIEWSTFIYQLFHKWGARRKDSFTEENLITLFLQSWRNETNLIIEVTQSKLTSFTVVAFKSWWTFTSVTVHSAYTATPILTKTSRTRFCSKIKLTAFIIHALCISLIRWWNTILTIIFV